MTPLVDSAASPSKRPLEADDESSSDEDVGPALPSTEPATKKRKRTLPHEQLYIAALPTGERYSKSLMHKDQVAFVTMTPKTDFLITAGAAGQVSFWKKKGAGGDDRDVEFVKEFKGTEGETLTSAGTSWDGRYFATCGTDGTVKVWDVVTFDLISVMEPAFTNAEGKPRKRPQCLCWAYGRKTLGGTPQLAVGNDLDGEVLILNGQSDGKEPIARIKSGRLHKARAVAMAYNEQWDCMVSADATGMLEYWQPDEQLEKPSGLWKMKSSTNLFDFKKSKSVPCSLTVSPAGTHFATFSLPDRQVRIFDFASGKLHRSYDESISTLQAMHQAGTAATALDDAEFARRLALERELDASPHLHARLNVLFDESSHFLLYAALHGIKVLNTRTNRLVRLYAADEPLRPLHLALYQGRPDRKALLTVDMAASANPLLADADARDALLAASALARQRFYLFSNDAAPDKSSRDVHNEKPRLLGATTSAAPAAPAPAALPSRVILRTTKGDITLRLFPLLAPRTVENFTTHARRGYYDNTPFHRVIRKFMIQGGDPLGDGSGGASIWGGTFADEIVPELRHDRPFVLSMANAGPGTNGSQFFITTAACAWLDGKHSIFGRVVEGMEAVMAIEGVKTRAERPVEEVRVVSCEVRP